MDNAAHAPLIAKSALPAVAVLIPLAGGIVVALVGRYSEKVRDYLAIAFTAGAFAVAASMFPRVMLGGEQLTVELPLMLGGFRLTADSLGLIFALAASLVWLLATIYSRNYIRHEERRTRYHAFSLFTEAATLGVFLAADFFVLFVFFELMGLLAYMLVVHNQTLDARKAGVKYIFMTVYGGLSLLMGVFLFLMYAGGLGFKPVAGSAYLATSVCFVVSGFMMGGFGVKAGMVPLHVWLPLAHPAAPSPASALLSGVMIKAGAFGFLRVIGTFHVEPAAHARACLAASHGGEVEGAVHHAPVFMNNLHNLGWVIIWLAMLTMVVGMVLALVQDNVKRLLAYSSISQMGYILMGLGIGAYLGAEGAMGLAGGIYHIMNHSLFKSLLFLGVGAVFYSTHHLEMTKLGGLWRKMPVTTALTCVGALGIMGIPLFNGFASKTLLHHSVVETLSVGGPWMRAVDMIFMIAAGGTVCYIAKLIILTFFGHSRAPDEHEVKEVPRAMRLGMGGLAAGVVFFGLFPGLVVRKFVLPALNAFVGLDPHAVEHVAELKFFSLSNLAGVLPPLAIGAGVFLVMANWNLFRLRLPKTLGIDYIYSRTEVGFLRLCFAGSRRYGELKDKYWPLARTFGEYLRDVGVAGRKRYRDVRRVAFDRVMTLPMDITGLAAYVRAKQFTGDIAYGIVVIAGMAALLAFVLLIQ
jgi:hydrogenase-4 component B